MKPLILALSLLMAGMTAGAAPAQTADVAKGTFEAGNGSFLLNGEPFVVKAAELHYPAYLVNTGTSELKCARLLA